MPDRVLARCRPRQPLLPENLWMDPSYQHLFIIGPIKDSDPSARRQIAGGTPEEVVLQLTCAGMREAEHLATLRIYPRHHVPNDAIFSGRIHGLKYQQNGVAVGCIKQLLPGTEFRDVLLQQFLVVLLRVVHWFYAGRPLSKVDLVPCLD